VLSKSEHNFLHKLQLAQPLLELSYNYVRPIFARSRRVVLLMEIDDSAQEAVLLGDMSFAFLEVPHAPCCQQERADVTPQGMLFIMLHCALSTRLVCNAK
jgi:hypothetical protein